MLKKICFFLRFTFRINGEPMVTDVTAVDDVWHHVVLTWTNLDGNWKLYKDGVICDEGTDFQTGAVIQGKILKFF